MKAAQDKPRGSWKRSWTPKLFDKYRTIKTYGFRTTYSATSPAWLIPRHPQVTVPYEYTLCFKCKCFRERLGPPSHHSTIPPDDAQTPSFSGLATPARILHQEPAASDGPAVASLCPIFTMLPGSGSFTLVSLPFFQHLYFENLTQLQMSCPYHSQPQQEEMQSPSPDDGRIEPSQARRGSSKPWPHCGIIATELWFMEEEKDSGTK